MSEWFNERYISRDEHQDVVAYYRKLVAKLHCNVRDLRAQVLAGNEVDARAAVVETRGENGAEDASRPAPPRGQKGDNIIRFDFRRKP